MRKASGQRQRRRQRDNMGAQLSIKVRSAAIRFVFSALASAILLTALFLHCQPRRGAAPHEHHRHADAADPRAG